MNMHFSILFLLILLAYGGTGCRFLSSAEDEAPFFEATIAGIELTGSIHASLEASELRIRGEFLHPDSSMRFLRFTLPEFDGEGAYALDRTQAIFGSIIGMDTVSYGYSSGRDEDQVRIGSYDADEGIIRGELFFYGVSFMEFDGTGRDDVFTASGRFVAELR